MKIEHLAIWTIKLDETKEFYEKYFNMQSSEKYINKAKQFSSFFLSASEGPRLELMHHPDIKFHSDPQSKINGLAHFAFSVGNIQNVIQLTHRLREDGYTIASEPRITGDGYYESVVLDPEGNRVEITE